MSDFSFQIPAKILLFGEHSVLMGSSAVTLPLWDFSAQLRFPDADKKVSDFAKDSNYLLKQFFNYLNERQSWFQEDINYRLFKNALDKGLFLESNFPTGCGLGSSASVCVAVYKAFGTCNALDNEKLMDLYGRMESFFHGKSSGIDPLTIHMQRPVVINKGKIEFIEGNENLLNDIKIYLLNSRIQRNAQKMINLFQDELNNDDFKDQFLAEYIPVLETIKDKISAGNGNVEWELLKELSTQQFRFFKNLIPEPISSIWNKNPSACFKLLGAGGGGYFLVFSKKDIRSLSGFSVKRVNLTPTPA